MMLTEQSSTSTQDHAIDRRLATLSTAIASFYGLGLLGLALLPLLAREVPHLLLLLNPTTGVLLVVSARVGLIPFVVLAVLRRVAVHTLFFFLGEWYGEDAVRRVERYSGRTSRMVEYIERAFARVRWPVILLAAGPLPSVLAGAGKMPRAHFFAIDIAGTLLSVLVARYAADIAADPLGAALRFSDGHAGLLTAICVAATCCWLLIRWWRGPSGTVSPGDR